jgi:capsular exopolysaccharide synthesis family protein
MLKSKMAGQNLLQDTGLPAARVPQIKRQERGRIDGRIVSIAAPDSFEAEQYRRLRYALEEKRSGADGVVVLVCSPAAGDGKSLTAINLAAALAQDNSAQVLLMDADLRRRSQSLTSARLIPDGVPGLVELMAHPQAGVQDLLRCAGPKNLFILPAGVREVAPYEVFRNAHFTQIIADARQHFEYVVIDAPPVVPVSDCKIIVPLIDWYIMVVAAHKTPRSMLEEALNIMTPEKALGLVFNRSDAPHRYYGYYGYYTSHGKNPPRWKTWMKP